MRQPTSLSLWLFVSTCSLATLALVGCQSRKGGGAPPAPVCPCGGTDSWGKPVKGGGGAMTLFSQRKWQRASTGVGGFCTEFDPADLSNSPAVTSGGFDVPLPTPFHGPWQIFGHDPQTGGPSSNGLELNLQNTGCHGEAGRNSFVLTALGDTRHGVGFYPKALPLRKASGDNKRFLDKSGACANDEDLCERMALIQTPAGKSTCVDGDCQFTIGP